MTPHHIPLAAGLSLVVHRSGQASEWAICLHGGGHAAWLSEHPTREAAVLAATDVASCCAAALAVAAGCRRAA